MAYSKDKFQLSHLLQSAWQRMGQIHTWKVTGGSATTVVNTAWAGVDEQVFDDNDPALVYGSVVVIQDAGGAGAAPEGEIASISAYDSSSYTITNDALSTAVASGDRVGTASPLFPYEDMKELANLALAKLGKIDLVDTSLTVVANQTEYTLPIRQKPKRVRVQRLLNVTNNHKWQIVQGWSVVPATTGTGWTLIIPPLTQGYGLEILYEDFHPKLLSFADDIIETIQPELAICALVAEAYQWYNNQVQGGNEYFLQRENKALQDLQQAKVNYPIYRMVEQVQGLPHWGRETQYVPRTSDLKG